MMDYKWTIVSDQFLDSVHFVISPCFGHLIEIHDISDLNKSPLMRTVAGFTKRTFSTSLHRAQEDPIGCLDEKMPSNIYPPINPSLIRKIARVSLHLFPLGFVIYCLFLSTKGGKPVLELSEAVSFVADAFGRRSNGNCLEIALCRYWLFCLLGWRTTIQIGVLFPTEEMHAWVALDGVPLLEDADFVGHYQAAVIYSDRYIT